MSTLENFVKERNEALFSLDRDRIEAYLAKHGDATSENASDMVFWAGVYKAICRIKDQYTIGLGFSLFCDLFDCSRIGTNQRASRFRSLCRFSSSRPLMMSRRICSSV